MRAEEADFEVFITADRSLPFQQNVAGRRIAIIVLSSNRWASIRPRVALIAEALAIARPGEVLSVDLGGR